RRQCDHCSRNTGGRETWTWRLNRRRASAAVSGMRSRSFSPVINGGGGYVRGGQKAGHRGQVPFLAAPLGLARPRGGVRGRWGGGGGGGDGEEGVGEHRQGDVPVPGAVLADLVVVQPGLVLGAARQHLAAAAPHAERVGHRIMARWHSPAAWIVSTSTRRTRR